MNVVKESVIKMIEQEEAAANKIHPLFQSVHEASAVIREEIEETQEALDIALKRFHTFWLYVKKDLMISDRELERLMDALIDVSCEAIQSAAMVKKEIESRKERDRA